MAGPGWYRLPSGTLYYGSARSGAVACRVPSLYQPVEPVESRAPVRSEVAAVDLTADAGEVVDCPVAEVGPAGDDEVDGTVERQAPKGKPRRKPSQPKVDQ